MESIRIHEEDFDIILYLDNNSFFGYKYNNDNTIEKIDENVFKYFNFLTCSNNYSTLANDGEYKVILDNNTNFKHYYKDDKEDYEMFFLNNGKELISYQSDKVKIMIKNISKAFIIGTATVCISLSGMNMVQAKTNQISNNAPSNQQIIVENLVPLNEKTIESANVYVANNDLTYDDVKSLIYGSSKLTDDEKKLLCNEDFINDSLEIINKSNLLKFDLLSSLRDIDIESYHDNDEMVHGYYKPITPNIIYIKDYNEMTSKIKDTISHEEMHMWQYHYSEYTLLKEACAEIMSEEYFEDSKVNSYYSEVFLVKKLMEIIGSKPVLEYNYTGNKKLIDNEVKPYLTSEQYKSFVECLNFQYNDSDELHKIDEEFNSLLNIIYKNKYGKNPSEDLVISLLDKKDNSLKRDYFNKAKKNESYYMDRKTISTISMTLDAAIQRNYVLVQEEVKEYVDYDHVYDFLAAHNNKGLTRRCQYIENFKEERASYKKDGVKVSGYLGDEYMQDIPEEELIEKGIILECDYYYIKDRKMITSKEYFNKEYNEKNKLNFIANLDKCYNVVFNEDGDLVIYISSIMPLPTIDEKFESSKVR